MKPKESLINIRNILDSESDDWGKLIRIKTITELVCLDKNESKVSMEQIASQICEHSGLSFDVICQKTNRRNIVVLRQLAMYKARKYTNYSLSVIGFFFGKKDHATVLHADRTITDLLSVDRKFRCEHEAFLIK
jgi:chromosomal replication initiator protein